MSVGECQCSRALGLLPLDASFRSCVLSWFFLVHLVWLSLMQLRLFLFIDILNPIIERLADGDPTLGTYTPRFTLRMLN